MSSARPVPAASARGAPASRREVAVVTGASRGLGLETAGRLAAHGLCVVLTARDAAHARAAADALRAGHPDTALDLEPSVLDVTDAGSVERLAAELRARHGRVDVLVNNAGIALHGFDGRVARSTIDTNFHGALRTTDALLPLLTAASPARASRIVNVSSSLGELTCLAPAQRARVTRSDLTREELVAWVESFVDAVAEDAYARLGFPRSCYAVSKVALNALTRLLARDLGSDGPRVNAVCPGWVRTDMGGSGAPRSVAEGAAGIVWAATLPAGGPTGEFFRDGESIAF